LHPMNTTLGHIDSISLDLLPKILGLLVTTHSLSFTFIPIYAVDVRKANVWTPLA